MPLNIYFKKLTPSAKTPTFGALGYNLFTFEETIIPAKTVMCIRTGIAAMLNSKHFVMRICARNSQFAEHNLIVYDDILPSTMNGEIIVSIHNHNTLPEYLHEGACIAHLLVTELIQPKAAIIEYEPPQEMDEDVDDIPNNQWDALEEGYINWPEHGYVAWREWKPKPHSTVITIDTSDDACD